MKKIRVGILGVAAAAALCFTAGAVYLYARGVWQMPIPADRALPVLMYHHIVEDGEPNLKSRRHRACLTRKIFSFSSKRRTAN